LQSLYSIHRRRVLWVDAICINQDDLNERSSLIQLMADIYGCSRQVLVRLGDADPDIHAAFDTVEKMDVILLSHEDESQLSRSLSNESAGESPDGSLIRFGLTEKELACLERAFLRSRWWWRLWCVQEYIYSPRAVLVCGDRTISWDSLPMYWRTQNCVVDSEAQPPYGFQIQMRLTY
jgi:hypothetical protein